MDEDGRVDCGPVIDGHTLVLVDPDTGTPVPEGAEGEIWISGPSISNGYWNSTGTPTGELFGVLDGTRRLRTGDLGRLRDGHLTVTGRRKDVLIQNGVNHHAHDLCTAATEDNPAVRPTAAAFAGSDDEVVIAVEVADRNHDTAALAADIRTRVLTATGVRVHTVVLCPPRTIPAPPAGRSSTPWPAPATSTAPSVEPPSPPHRPPPRPRTRNSSPSSCPPSSPPSARSPPADPTRPSPPWAVTPLRAAEIAAVAEDALTLEVRVEDVLRAQTPRELTARLARRWADDELPYADALERVRTLMSHD